MSHKKTALYLGIVAVVLAAVVWLTADQPWSAWQILTGSGRPKKYTTAEISKMQKGFSEQAKLQKAARDEQNRQKAAEKREGDHAESMRVDREIRAAFEKSKSQRWVELPKKLLGVYVDGAGRTWVSISPFQRPLDPDDIRLSVEEVVAGKAFCFRDCRPLLIDSRGRVWINSFGYISGYDGNKWTHVDLAGKEVTDLAKWSSMHPSNWAVEDKLGGLWFAGRAERKDRPGSDPLFLQLTRDGQWRQHRFPDVDPVRMEELLSHGRVVCLDGGQLLIAPAGEKAHLGLAYYDGAKWTIEKTLEGDRSVSWVAPMANGSVAVLDYGRKELSFHWPDPKLADNAEVRRWVEQLDSDDGQVRHDATIALVRNGEAIRPILQRALSQEKLSPETRLRIESVAALLGKSEEELSELAQSNADVPNRDLLPWIRYDLLEMVVWDEGKVVLCAEDCTDRATGKYLGDKYVEFTGNGNVRLMKFSEEPWRGGSDDWMYESFVDTQKRIWVAQGCRIRPDGTVEEPLPAGLRVNDVVGPDKDGRLYLDKDLVLNESIPQEAPALREKLMRFERSTFSVVGKRLWIAESRHWPHGLSLMDDGKTVKPIPVPWKNAGIALPMFCFGPGVLIGLNGPDEDTPPDFEYAFYDGGQWDTDESLQSLVRRHVEFLSRHANPNLKGYEWVRFGGTPDRFWFYQSTDHWWDQKPVCSLSLYDGTTWHDVGAALGWEVHDYTHMTLVDHGRSMMLVQVAKDAPDRIWLVELEQGELKPKLLREVPVLGMSRHKPKAIYLGGETWLKDLTNDGGLSILRNGAVTDMPYKGQLLLGDSVGRGWLYDWDKKVIRVFDEDAWGEIAIDGCEDARVMGEDPSGRNWLLHGKGISQLEVSKDGGKVVVKETARYPWNRRVNQLSSPCFDDAGGLWLLRSPLGWTRIQLP